MIDTLSITISRACPAMSMPMLNAERIAISTPNSMNAKNTAPMVKMRAELPAQQVAPDDREELHASASSALPSGTSTPFSRCSVRLARAAACGSCVTMTMVLP